MVRWTWYFPSVVEISTLLIWDDNIKIYVEDVDGIYLAPDMFHSESATNTLLGVNFDVHVTVHP